MRVAYGCSGGSWSTTAARSPAPATFCSTTSRSASTRSGTRWPRIRRRTSSLSSGTNRANVTRIYWVSLQSVPYTVLSVYVPVSGFNITHLPTKIRPFLLSSFFFQFLHRQTHRHTRTEVANNNTCWCAGTYRLKTHYLLS